MISSMTAFARQETQDSWAGRSAQMVWELRSVNHRYLDIQPRLPEELRALEPEIRRRVDEHLSRGKVEASLYLRNLAQGTALEIDWQRAATLAGACAELLTRFDPTLTPAPATELLRFPGVINEPPGELQPLKEAALELFDAALGELIATRKREGERLTELLRKRLEASRKAVNELTSRRQGINQQVRERLEARLTNLSEPADPGRLEQEMAYIAQRLDIDEELDRLQAHFDEVERLLDSDATAIGRRLDFLMQELNREANTIASKAADSSTTNTAIDLKVWIEQMREQIQNVE